MAVRPIIRGIVQPVVRDIYGTFEEEPVTGVPVIIPGLEPMASGIPYIGNDVETTRGAWTQSPTMYYYQWYQGTPASETLITGAEAMTYQIQAGDLGETLFCRVTAENSFGLSLPEPTNVIGPAFDAEDYRIDGDGNFRVVDDGDYRITGG